MENQHSRLSHRSSLNYDHRVLNYQWQQFKTALTQSAHDTLIKRMFSPYIYQDKLASDELRHLQLQNSLLNQIYYIIPQFLYETKDIKKLEYQWTFKKPASKRTCLLEINSQYANTDGYFDLLEALYLLTRHNRT